MRGKIFFNVIPGINTYYYQLRQREALRQAQAALVTAVNVNVPHYHPETDSFVYDDGKVISNTDPVFK